MESNDRRLRRALDSLIERGLIVKSGHGIYEIAK
jgi:hypothetical protein